MGKKHRIFGLLCVVMCVFSTVKNVRAEKVLINYTSPDSYAYSVRKTDMESRFYINVVKSNRTGVLMCYSQNDQDPSICSDTISISLTPGMVSKAESGAYRKPVIPGGMYSLHLKCSLPGVNVQLYYSP